MSEQNYIKYIKKKLARGSHLGGPHIACQHGAVALKPGTNSAKPLGINPSFLSQIKHPEQGGHGIKLHGIPGVARN